MTKNTQSLSPLKLFVAYGPSRHNNINLKKKNTLSNECSLSYLYCKVLLYTSLNINYISGEKLGSFPSKIKLGELFLVKSSMASVSFIQRVLKCPSQYWWATALIVSWTRVEAFPYFLEEVGVFENNVSRKFVLVLKGLYRHGQWHTHLHALALNIARCNWVRVIQPEYRPDVVITTDMGSVRFEGKNHTCILAFLYPNPTHTLPLHAKLQTTTDSMKLSTQLAGFGCFQATFRAA